MQKIDGTKISSDVRAELKEKVSVLKKKGIEPGLATILVGSDPASQVYVNSKIKACEALDIKSFHHQLPSSANEKEIINLINKLNNDSKVSGILLQLPLPQGLNANKCVNAISHEKDVDGLTAYNLGKLFSIKSWDEVEKNRLFVPCTPLGVIYLLKKTKIEMSGKNAVVIGRSNLVGKPIAMLLLSNDASVTMVHSKTKNIANICKQADIIVAAIGKEKFVNKDFVKQGAAIIDVGINRTDAGLCGDVDADSVRDVAGYLSPVPKGVGPMTITMLMHNTILASESIKK
ncbi:bifunctional 5,10-methylenetetrahydrofolate dehydrogenase/5,10-methenyltetrahydrofolate cyclohydrolase [Elusimicrobiota bacterium]